ncbi:RNA-directed DNA polymerase, eukaryota, reverse transcriptase zinc-binding domain protein [Tanacetum coccineum]
MEGLNIMLKDGIAANLFRGIKIGSPSLHLSYLFYVDNVIIFSEWHQSDMYNIICILDLFFLASGLTININKSNLYGVGVSSNEFIHMAEARLSSWKANLLSSGGRLTLIKAVLGSQGGLGVNVVKSIHGDEAGIDLKGCQTNGLWARIVGTIFQLHSSGIVPLNSISFKAGDGSLIRFWKDTWLGDVPLCSRFNRLFKLERDKNCILRDRFANGDWSWDWYRPINRGRTLADLNSLLMDLSSVILSNDVDVVSSSLSSNGIYSVSDVRIHIDDCMLLNSLLCTRWFKAIPRKVNIFMWRLFLDWLPHHLNLSSWGLDIDFIMCPLCNKHVESNSHFFSLVILLVVFGPLFEDGVILNFLCLALVKTGTRGISCGMLLNI